MSTHFIVEKKEKDRHNLRRGFSNIREYALNERSAILTIRVNSFFGDCVRSVSQKINCIFYSHGNHATTVTHIQIENLTNYAEAILAYLFKHFSKKGGTLLPSEPLLSMPENPITQKEVETTIVSNFYPPFMYNGVTAILA